MKYITCRRLIFLQVVRCDKANAQQTVFMYRDISQSKNGTFQPGMSN